MEKHVQKSLAMSLIVLIILSLTGYFLPQASAAVQVSRIAINADGKGYLEVDGKPFLYSCVQTVGYQMCLGDRSCNGTVDGWLSNPLPLSKMENVFEKAAALNYKILSIILNWRHIEPTYQNSFDWTIVNQYIDWANKYNLRLDFAWFGQNGCGGTRLPGYKNGWMCQVPAYLQNQSQYWGRGQHTDGQFYPWILGQGHDTDVNYLRNCELTAVTALMNHLAIYDTNHRVVFFQLDNECNMHPDWGDYWRDWMNTLGQAIKNSNYVVATRANFASQTSDYATGQRPYIDCNGADPYSTSLSTIASAIDATQNSKMTYIAENGPYDNATSLALTAITHGGFYSTWELFNEWWDGLYVDNFKDTNVGTPGTFKHVTYDMKNLNAAMNNIGSLIAQTSRNKMVGFNLDSDYPSGTYNNYKTVNGKNIYLYCTDGSVGMTVNNGNYYYCLSDTSSNTDNYFTTCEQPVSAQFGYLDANGNWVNQGNVSPYDNGNGTWGMQYNAQKCLRIELTGTPTPTPGGGGSDLAQGKNVTVSSTYGTGYEGSKAVDGNDTTRWCGRNGYPYWIYVDLGSTYLVNQVNINWELAYGINYQIQVSTDASNWTTVQNVTGNGSSGLKTYNFTAADGRYVRVYVTSGADNVCSIWTLNVYSSGGGSTPTPTPGGSNIQVDLSSYYNADAWSYDTNRSDCAIGGYSGYGYSADLLNINPTYDGVSYTLGPKTDGANNQIKGTGQTITLTQGRYSSIRLLGASTGGNQTGTFRINYTDSTYTDASVSQKDWATGDTSGQMVEQTMTHTHIGGSDSSGNAYIFAYYLTPTSGKTVSSIVLPNNSNIQVYAITLVP